MTTDLPADEGKTASVDSGHCQLSIEYRQKRFCDSLVPEFLRLSEEPCPRGGGGRTRSLKEATNVVERWILSLQSADNASNGASTTGCGASGKLVRDPELPLFPRGMQPDDAAARLLALDAYDKGFCRLRRSATNLAAGMTNAVERFRRRCYNTEPTESSSEVEARLCMVDEDRGCLRIGRDYQSAASRRLPYLVERFGLQATARMLLRYEALGSGSYQWGDPLCVHRLYYREFAARYEGFASPLNSRFLGMDGAGFCSLFPDTDSVFGSLGNFFSVDLAAHPGGWSVNPPFVEAVLESAARKVLDCLAGGTASWFFLNYPDWRDSPGWSLLDASPHKAARFDFAPGEFLVQDAFGRPVRPKMRLSIFVLGRLPDGSPPLERLRDVVFKARPPGPAEKEGPMGATAAANF